MKVIFKSAQRIGARLFGASSQPQEILDRLAHTQEFKALVKSGAVIVLPKSEADQKLQAMKDADSAKKAADAVEKSN